MRYFLITIPLLWCSVALAQQGLVINEIAWMGTTSSYNDEWIELYNPTEEEIKLKGFSLKTNSLEINLEGSVGPDSFYLLERTDDTTVPNIPADLIYTGSLRNSGEVLSLYSEKELIDKVDCSLGWKAGDNQAKETMEKKGIKWQNSKEPGGTPRAENSVLIKQSEEIPEAESPLLIKDYPEGIIFSEIMPSPEGPDKEEEWIKIYNENSFGVDLAGWQIRDIQGRSATFTFPQKMILGKSYLTLLRPETGITLNNSGDALKLNNPNGKTVDSVSYKKAPEGESFKRIGDEWVWNGDIVEQKDKEKPRSAPIKSSLKDSAEDSNGSSVLFTASFLALFCAVLILILKISLNKKEPLY